MCQVLEIFHFRVYTDRIQGFLTQVGIYVYFNLAFTPRVMLIFPKIILSSLSLIRNWEFTTYRAPNFGLQALNGKL